MGNVRNNKYRLFLGLQILAIVVAWSGMNIAVAGHELEDPATQNSEQIKHETWEVKHSPGKKADFSQDTGPDSITNDDPCRTSTHLHEKFSCAGTQSLIQVGQITNALGQAVGTAATQLEGQKAQLHADENGTQSAAIEGAAKAQERSGQMLMINGIMNTGFGVMHLSNGSGHKSNAAEIKTMSKTIDSENKIDDNNADNIAGTGKTGQDGTHEGFYKSKGLSQQAIENFNLNSAVKLREVETVQGVINAARNKANNDQAAATADLNPITHQLKQTIANESLAKANALQDLRKAEIKKRQEGSEEKASDMKKEIGKIKNASLGEQMKTAAEAKAAGMQSLITGVGQLASGYFNLMAAKELKKAAKNLKEVDSQGPILIPSFGKQLDADPVAPRTSTTITGSGATPDQGSAADTSTDTTPLDNGLGPPIAEKKDEPPVTGPAPGAFTPGTPPPAGGGGGGGGLGSGTTGVATQEQTDGGGLAQRNFQDTSRFARESGGGGGGGYAGGGGGKGGEVASPSTDGSSLQDMLKKMLGKDDEHGNNILDYTGRNLAGETASYLDRNVNIFQRVHETYQAKNKKGQVGI